MSNRPVELSNMRILAAASAMTVTVVAWGVLVFAAIDFGRTARAGENNGWLYLVLSTVGAVACMFGAIVMAAQLHALMRVAQHSSTRPLAQPLSALPPLPEPEDLAPWAGQGRAAEATGAGSLTAAPYTSTTGPTTTTYPSAASAGDAPQAQPGGKRAAR